MEVSSDHALKELLYNIEQKDLIKARLVLECIDLLDPKTQKRMLFELSKCDDDFALPLLGGLIVKKPAIVERFPNLREIILAKALDNPELVLENLQKSGPEQEVFVRLAGDLNLRQAVPILLDILQADSNQSLIKATLQALGKIGDPDACFAVSDFLYYQESDDVVLQAIESLGQIGTPTAIQRLAEIMGRNREWDIRIMDIFAQTQDTISLQKLNTGLQSHSAYIRNYARGKLREIGAKAVPMLTQNLVFNDPDLQILSLNVLGEIGDPSAIGAIRKLLDEHPKNANVRFAAYEALGMLPLHKGSYTLAGGLLDPDPSVRIAAAKAIDHNYNQVLEAGVKNMVKAGDGEAANVIKSIIDAQAAKIVMSVVDLPAFHEIGLNYLNNKAHPELRNYYIDLFKRAERKDLAGILEGKKEEPAEEKPLICVVDDSKMILKIYRSALFALGYAVELFEFPEKALEWLQRNRPALVFTDLNMPKINGIELVSRARKVHPVESLPIIVVTTQNDTQDKQELKKVGATDILHKPFTKEMLQGAIQKYVS